MAFRISVDTGGTFTDVVIADARGIRTIGKALTTPDRIFDGMRAAIEVAAQEIGLSREALLGQSDMLIYGTTRATNAVVTQSTAKTAFLTTRGFRDVLVLKEGGKYDPHDYSYDYPPPYIPRRYTFEIDERVDAQGNVVHPLDQNQARDVMRTLAERKFEAVAVCLLWSIANGSHEKEIGRLIERELPGVPFTLSHELIPIVREYRRASTTAIDASLKPLMQRHLREMESDLRAAGFSGELLIGTSGGGCQHVTEVVGRPVTMLKSGPAMAPVAGKAYITIEDLGRDAIVCDTGGTTFDVGLVRDGELVYTRDSWLGRRWLGHMVAMSTVDVRSIGAGGGSIAWIDAGGHAFETDDHGRLLYPEQVYGAIKKSGKTGFAALYMLTIILLFGGRFAEGYALANNLEQATSRVFQAIKRIVEASPLLRREAKITADKITFPAFYNATISAIASDYTGAAGANPTIPCFDELWGYVSERSHRLWDEMVPPPTRKIACRLTVTYAGFSGESVLLEELHKRGLQQPRIGPSLYAGDGLLMAWHREPIAPWQDEKWLADMRRSLRPNQYLRMIENRFVTSESSFVDMAAWDRCTHPDLRTVVTDKTMYVWLGVDASTKHDSTAIVGVTFDRKSKQVRLVFHRVFQPTPEKPLQFEATIEATLKELSHRFQFQKVMFDPWQMQAVAQRLASARLPIEEFPQTSGNLTAASQNLYELIEGGNLVLYPDANMRLAASRAVAVETSRGWRISKEKQSHKIDVIVALAMACHAAVQGSSEPYFDRSFAGFQDDFVDLDRRGGDAPDDTAGKSSSNYAVQQMKAFIATGGLIGEGPIAIGGRWR